jgi:hypothetical protein
MPSRVSHISDQEILAMFGKCTVSAMLVAILMINVSAAVAAPRQKNQALVNRPPPITVPITGAEWWQNKGISEEVGIPYRRR